ncbi:MAG: DUF523 domain-containing protein [Planctomycetota bacterium]
MTESPSNSDDLPVTLVSACLLGRRCRYNAEVRVSTSCLDAAEKAARRWVSVCPEELGGLSTPRPAADIDAGFDGEDVLDGRARVRTVEGDDVTREFLEGAKAAAHEGLRRGATRAVLKSRSPSCGCGELSRSDGTRDPGWGVFAALLRRHGVEVDAADFDPREPS